ncbi:unnamed protein product [Phytophthora lilii]|uniref:Unnamed protein product n=1 Tax=Phytophthora lilii TaxID=2077276 RepID=A0A9W6WQR7_9STRA|nr:unnamed protein product [Phytophthora lilii]
MADFMSTSVIPVMDDLARQILREKPNSVKGECGECVAARIVIQSSENAEEASNQLEAEIHFSVKDRVMCRYKGRPRFYLGTITAIDSNGSFTVLYDDGKTENNVHYMCIKPHHEANGSQTNKEQMVAGEEAEDNQEKPKVTRKMEIVLLIIGIDGAGKTTLLSTLQGDLDKEHVPSAGFTSATFQTETGSATFYDLGGGPAFRNVWNDFANKRDHSDAVEEQEMQNLLRLNKFPSSKIVPCIAKPAVNGGAVDERLEAGLQWLFDEVHETFDTLHERVQRDLVLKKKLDQQRREEQRARVSRWKEERELNQMRGHDKPCAEDQVKDSKANADTPEEAVIYCSNCSTAPAVTKCAASKWMPVCEACVTTLRSQNQ